jgi:GT2 family glycosyltransferase
MFGVAVSRSLRAKTQESASLSSGNGPWQRPTVQGKFLYAGAEKLWIRGVTYGTFHPDAQGNDYHPEQVRRDFALMTENGFNALRTYTVPPRWLLDSAQEHGLRVMVGLPWEQHVAFLGEKKCQHNIAARVRASVRSCANHPAVLCYTIGNEIPAPIVRWHGRRRVEQYLERLYLTAKEEDPEGLVTYVNYPTTEYLQLPFLDLVGFNVYLETQERLAAYLARLQHLAGDRPLVMAEVGLDSRRHGEARQAQVLDWQIRTAFAAGCAGTFVFSWTDEWYRGGHDIADWDFGVTDRQRRPKPALTAVRNAFAEVPFPKDLPWPRISVIVCSYNGARTIRDCCEALLRLEYPNYEVMVIDDGSTDATAAIALHYGFRLISTENRGLSSARNTGMQAAMGEIVAYIDDDAYPDPHWLTYLAATFLTTSHVGVGGPNYAPPGDGMIADCVANAPGGPLHVMLSDQEAEHIPGCNMAFRKTALQAIGGFDPQFRTAGDDVDVCWQLQKQGWTIGFHPAAMVWHHRRNSVRTYWRQQKGYGKAEALLARKWPEKYNVAGHPSWAGRLYGKGITRTLNGWRGRIYQGTWGSALFQSIYEPAPALYSWLPLMPEWYLIIATLAVLSILGLFWPPLLLAAPCLAGAVGVLLVQASLSTVRASFTSVPVSRREWLSLRLLTASLHLLQPLARLLGRLRYGLTPWRWRSVHGLAAPWPCTVTLWSEQWHEVSERLQTVETALRACETSVMRGGDYDAWDLEVRGGLLGAVRLLTATEDHGAGRQLVRFRVWPKYSARGLILFLLFATLATGAGLHGAWHAVVILALSAGFLAGRTVQECAGAMATMQYALNKLKVGEQA